MVTTFSVVTMENCDTFCVSVQVSPVLELICLDALSKLFATEVMLALKMRASSARASMSARVRSGPSPTPHRNLSALHWPLVQAGGLPPFFTVGPSGGGSAATGGFFSGTGGFFSATG